MRSPVAAIVFALLGCAVGPALPPPSEQPTGASPHAPSVGAGPLLSPLIEMHVEPPSEPNDAPTGFAAVDEFSDIATACTDLVPRIVERADLREPITAWCISRAYHSSRNGVSRSRIDGSMIHDRDRPAARAFYSQGVRAGLIDPSACQRHAVDTTIKRSRGAREIVDRWPYATHCEPSSGGCTPTRPGRMDPRTAARWLRTPVDYERFGTRGPMDNHFAVAVRYLGGCFGPEQLDRNDVAAAVVIERAEALCLDLERRLNTRRKRAAAKAAWVPTRCSTAKDIRTIWSPSWWYRTLPRIIGYLM